MSEEPTPPIQPDAIITEAAPKADRKGVALASFIIGIVNLFAWCLPVCGLGISIAGVVTGVLGLNSSKRWMAITGIALSALGFILSIAWLILRSHLNNIGFFDNFLNRPFLP